MRFGSGPFRDLNQQKCSTTAQRTANTRGAAPDSMPVMALGRIGRLGLGGALKQAPHRADAEKNADDGADPEPEHT